MSLKDENTQLRARVAELEKERDDFVNHVGAPNFQEAVGVLLRTKQQDEDTIAEMFGKIKATAAERDQLRTQNATLSEQLEEDKYKREEWSTIIKKWGELCEQLETARNELDEVQKAAGFCHKHQPNGGARNCLVCGCEKLSHALSRIAYACEPSNEMEVSSFDLYCDEEAVVCQVKSSLAAERTKLEAALKEIEAFKTA